MFLGDVLELVGLRGDFGDLRLHLGMRGAVLLAHGLDDLEQRVHLHLGRWAVGVGDFRGSGLALGCRGGLGSFRGSGLRGRSGLRGTYALPTALNSVVSLSDAAVKAIAIVLILVLTVYNCFGIKAGTILQNVSMIAKLIPIAVILLAGLFLGKQSPDLSLATESTPTSFGGIIGMIAFATVATLWAYEGWTNLNALAEEIKEPGKSLPRALIIGISAITIIYALFNFSIYKVLPADQISTMIENDNLYLGTEVVKTIFGRAGGALILATQIIAIFGSLNGMIIAFPRNYYEMARDGHFFKSHAKLHPKYAVPHAAFISQAVISIILVLCRNLDQLTSLVVFSSMIYNLMVIIAVLVYRKKFPDLERPYKVWGYPVTVIITIIIFTALAVNTLIEDPLTAVIGLVVPIAGVIVWWIFDRRLKRGTSNETSAH